VIWLAFTGNKKPVELISLDEGAPRQKLIRGEEKAWLHWASRAFSSTIAGPLCRNREAAGGPSAGPFIDADQAMGLGVSVRGSTT
jgi:hypothetical protein